jgi:hypothetical protein
MANRGTRLPTLADMLADSGYEVEYVTTDFSHARKEHYSASEIEECRKRYRYQLTVFKTIGYVGHLSVRRVLSHIYLSTRFFIYLSRVLRKGDLLLIPSRPPELLFCAHLFKMLKNIRIHMDITDIWPDMLKNAKKWQYLLFTAYCNIFQVFSIRSFDSYTYISPCAVPWLAKYAPGKTSRFIPLGYDSERWKMASISDKSSGTILFSYVGTLTYHFDLRPFLKALVGRKDVVFTIIGDGECLEEIRDFVSEHHMDNVTLLGAVAPEEVVRILRTQHIGISPEVSEVSAIPNKIFDYIASYCPVLVLGENDSAQFIRERDIGWALPFDEEKIKIYLDTLTYSEIEKKIKNISDIREKLSKEYLYKEFMISFRDS